MAVTNINTKARRFVKKSGIFQIDIGGSNQKQLKFVQQVRTSINLGSFDKDLIDDQAPCWSQVSDILGDFSFQMKMTADMFDSVSPATDDETISYWKEAIAKGLPAEIKFIEVNNAPNGDAGFQVGTEKWTGRITGVDNETFTDRALLDATITGDIIEYTSGIRA